MKKVLVLIFIHLFIISCSNTNDPEIENDDPILGSWQETYYSDESEIYDISAPNKNFACVVGGTDYLNNSLILFTTNGGRDWYKRNNVIKRCDIEVCFFLNEKHGWFVTDEGYQTEGHVCGLYKIRDTLAGITKIYDFIGSISFLQFVDTLNGYATSIAEITKSISKTTDGGYTWETINIPNLNNNISDIFFIDEINGWLLTKFELYRTYDGGYSWDLLYNIHQYYNDGLRKYNLQFLNEKFGYFLNIAKSDWYYTTDAGLTWEHPHTYKQEDYRRLYQHRSAIKFFDEKNGYCCFNSSSEECPYKTEICYTTDGGNTWETEFTTNIVSFDECIFVDENTGFAFTYDNRIYCKKY